MQAIVFPRYGAPDVLELREVEKPTPQAGEVLVHVRAAATNALDWHVMRGQPFLARLEYGLRAPKSIQLGSDLAGTVEAVGSGVTRFQIGDAVFGEVFHSRLGSFAEAVCVPETALAHKPESVSFIQAAAAPLSGLTALQGLRDKGKLKPGQRVLVNGASGGVGSFAVQLAKHFGAHVTAVSSARNLALVRGLGADEVIDYQTEDFTQHRRYDLILDAVGNRSIGALQRALTPHGKAVIVGFTGLLGMLGHTILGGLASRGGQSLGMMGTVVASTDDLALLATLLERGSLRPVIDRTYPLAQAADALRYLETGRARGKVVLTVG
ncbi:MAG: NAD(P)-dependent alcohol dehydrogenase [Anaerolineae bacterium]|nr:NAD(P)-dependent alcohol dehydrogenase [Anaerolineae bacterium]